MFVQAAASRAEIATLSTQLDASASSSHSDQEANAALTNELNTAQAAGKQLQEQLATLQQQVQHDKANSAAAFESQLHQKEHAWNRAKNDAVATALADQAARDEALRQCLRAELLAAAQQEQEGFKQDSSAALKQMEAAQQRQVAELQDQHAEALSSQAADFERQMAHHAQQAAAESKAALAADAARLQKAHAEELQKHAEKAAQQLEDCKQK